MTQPAVPAWLEYFAEALLSVDQGRRRLVLRLIIFGVAVAAVFWGLGYAAEINFGISVPGLPPTRDQGVLASILPVLIIGGYVVTGYGMLISGGAFDQPAKSGALVQTEPSVPINFSWWVLPLCIALAASLGGILLDSFNSIPQWLQGGGNSGATRNIADVIFREVFFVAIVAIAVGVVSGTLRLFNRMQPVLIASPGPWALVCAIEWVSLAAMAGFLFWFFCHVVGMILWVFGVATSITPATAIAGILYSALLASIGAAMKWQERTKKKDAPPSPRQDFWAWDLAPETAHGGMAATGYPFYVWRESADNQLGVSRPRYCVIADDGRELNFMFFDPSEDRQPTWGALIGSLVAVSVTFAMTAATWWTSGSVPFLSFFGTVLLAALIGALAGSIWHVVFMVWRWNRGRFEGDGRFTVKPLRLLSGFDKVHAGEVGAKIDGEKAKTGHGLTATFEDGTMIILTGNAWNYRSVVEHHQELTNAFRVPREDYVAKWEAKQKKIAASSQPEGTITSSSSDAPRSGVGVPEQL